MNKMILLLCLIVLSISCSESSGGGGGSGGSSELSDIEISRNSDLRRGINLGNALDAPEEGDWGEVLEEAYFDMIRDRGFNHIRIPIRWSTHALYEPPYTIEEALFNRGVWAVDNTINRDMIAVIDMHHYREISGETPESSSVYPSDLVLGPENHRDRFLAMWTQIAEHYRDYPDELYFEILNEPNNDLTPELWNEYLLEAYTIIREGKLIYEREPYKVILEPRILNEYFDFRAMMLRNGLSRGRM